MYSCINTQLNTLIVKRKLTPAHNQITVNFPTFIQQSRMRSVNMGRYIISFSRILMLIFMASHYHAETKRERMGSYNHRERNVVHVGN